MLVVLRLRLRRSRQSACPPESLWAQYGASLLSYSERAGLHKHCLRCKVCEARRNGSDDSTTSGRVLDWASTRIAAGLVAVILLAGAMQLESLRKFRHYEFAGFSVLPMALSPVQSEEPAEPEEQATAPARELEVGRTRPVAIAAPERSWTDDLLRPIGPYRAFVPPRRKAVTIERIHIDAPPVLAAARSEMPNVLLGTPSLQPPRRSPIRKFVSALATPFRHL